MEIKDIVEKALKDEDYSSDITDFDDQKLKELNVALKGAYKTEADTELAKVTALRAEKRRLEGNPPKKEDSVQSQFRDEQVQLAKEKFFADPKFKLSDEEKVQFESTFKKLDTGKIASELIIDDLKSAYAVINRGKLLDSQDKVHQFEKDAAEFNAGQAGGSSGQGSPDESKYSQAAKDLHKSWVKSGVKDKSLEDAQRLADRGGDWKGRNL